MHMADALISPEVGGTMLVVSATGVLYASHKVNQTLDDFKVPLMGVMGAFVFASQMINFSIPGTGSSGHICGSLLLSVLLGPYAALVVIASVLLVQALIFADGGLLALGCNICNMGVIPCLVAYPLIYRTIAGRSPSRFRLWAGSISASVVGLQLGAFAVVLETCFSGISELPFTSFILLMLPIHLAIGVVEGIITASVLTLIKNARPELISGLKIERDSEKHPLKGIIIATLSAALIVGGVLSWFASEKPDGLEWAIAGTTKGSKLESSNDPIHSAAMKIQESSSILPDYGFKAEGGTENSENSELSLFSGTTVSGIAGSLTTLILAMAIGLFLKHKFRIREISDGKNS